MKVLVIDPKTAGISGDMLLAALIDLTGSGDLLVPLIDAINELPSCEHFSCEIQDVDAGGITAKKLAITIREKNHRHHDDMRGSAEEIAQTIGLSEIARKKAMAIINDLFCADGKLHRSKFQHHAMASVDTLFDILGSVLILDRQGFLEGEICGTPPVLGSGFIRIAGGEIACPAPIVMEVLSRHRVPYSAFPADMELTTPTGAAIFANITERIVEAYPPMTPLRVGYGTGTWSIPGRTSVLRVVEGTNFDAIQDRIIMLETNLDDAPGETIGFVVERLREAGAVDVYVSSAYGKKNRPVQILHIITNQIDYPKLMEILMEETGTLGVRILDIPRLVAHRVRQTTKIMVDGQEFDISVKTSTVDGKIIAKKAEYEDLKRIARSLNIPLNNVREQVLRQLQ
ncbi:nickel pincer cofactor biosynthesis protein LarC [Methanoregula sp.]|uniref:nickel pincer cofactor biosynthesis protein LarC n=1 Tax=Methanoregula sp. TaxID=2052170 RepID=UPI003BB034DB